MDTIDCPKCEHEHDPAGNHDDDSGEMECEECGFKFIVTIEYEPSYSTECAVHEWSERVSRHGEPRPHRFCVNCRIIKLECD